ENGMRAGLNMEAKNFGLLAATPESQAMVNLFFAMQGAKKNPAKEQVAKVEKLGVLGAGLMGSGIADVSADKGDYRVLLKDQNAEQAAAGKKHIWQGLEKKRTKGITSEFERARPASLVPATGSYEGFSSVDLVIE